MEFYGLTDADIPKQLQPGFVLSVETEELGINAGLHHTCIYLIGEDSHRGVGGLAQNRFGNRHRAGRAVSLLWRG